MEIELVRSTGDWRIDEMLRGALGLLDSVMPDRIRSAYLTGSLADGTAIRSSDVDVLVVLKGSVSDDERGWLHRFRRYGSVLAGRFLDFVLEGEDKLFAEGRTPAKTASFVLVAGEETRDRWPAESDAECLHKLMRGSFFYLGHFRGSQGPLTYPLTYPDADGEFFGYERRGYHDPEGWISPGTKAFVGGMTLAASVIVAVRTGQLPVTKSQSQAAYRERIGDEWAPWLEALSAACRGAWSYRVPEAPSDRAQLRRLCERALDFENHYLRVSQQHLLAGLRGADEAEQARSLDTLFRLRYPGEEVAEAISALTDSPNGEVTELARRLHSGERYITTRWQ
jgi:hypothetical protein